MLTRVRVGLSRFPAWVLFLFEETDLYHPSMHVTLTCPKVFAALCYSLGFDLFLSRNLVSVF